MDDSGRFSEFWTEINKTNTSPRMSRTHRASGVHNEHMHHDKKKKWRFFFFSDDFMGVRSPVSFRNHSRRNVTRAIESMRRFFKRGGVLRYCV